MTTMVSTIITPEELAEILDALTDDGDTFELNDGRVLRLKIDVDQDASINDYDCYGKVEWSRSDGWSIYQRRPEGFDGAARKLDIYSGGSCLWWQPSPDMVSAKRWGGKPEDYDKVFREHFWHVKELAEYGFKNVGLELLEGVDTYGRLIPIAAEWLGGVDSVDNGYLRTLVEEQLFELEGVEVAR